MHPRPRADDARAVGQRDRQSAVRHRRLRKRQRLHLGGEQPRVPAHPVAQRSGHRHQRRGDLHPRRGDRAFLVALAAAGRGQNPYVVRHGFGYSIFEYTEDGIVTELCVYVATDAPVKFARLKITNRSGRPRQLSVTGYWELVLGELRDKTLMHVVTELDPVSGALFARNAYSPEFADRVAFVDCSETNRTVTGDRTEFLGRNGTPANPAAMRRVRLSGRVGAGLDPCAAMQVPVTLEDGQEKEIVFIARRRRRRRRRRGNSCSGSAASPAPTGAGRRVALLEPDARRGLCRNARPGRQLPGQRLARLPDARLPHVGPHRILPVGRRVRLPRPIAGRDGPGACRAAVCCASTCSAPPPASFARGTCSTGGIRPSGRGVRTHFSDDYLWLP